MLYRALMVLTAVAAPALLIFALVPDLLLRTAFGPDTVDAAGALIVLGIAMTLLAVSYLTVQYLFALHLVSFLWVLAVIAAGEILVLFQASQSITGFATTVLATQLVAALAVLGLAARARPLSVRAPEAAIGPLETPVAPAARRGPTGRRTAGDGEYAGAPMRLLLPRAICLGSPTALAFFAGGFNDRSRHIALIVTAVGLALAAALRPRRRCRAAGRRGSRSARSACSAAGRRSARPGRRSPTRRPTTPSASCSTWWCSRSPSPSGDPGARRGGSSRSWPLGAFGVIAVGLAGRLLPGHRHPARVRPVGRPARPAADLLERRGRPGGDGPRPVRAHRGRPRAPAARPRRRGRRDRPAGDRAST